MLFKLVDLYRPTLDPVHAGRSGEKIGATDEHLSRLGEGNARLAAAENHFLPGVKGDTFAIDRYILEFLAPERQRFLG